MTTREALIQARALIADPERWTQGAIARTLTGHICSKNDPAAVRWCAQGATWRVAEDPCEALDLLDVIATEMGWNSDPEACTPSANLNDHGTHADVLAMFDRAIEATA